MERLTRRQQRIWTLQALYEIDFCQIDANEAITNLEERENQVSQAEFAKKLIHLGYNNLQEIDQKLEQFSTDWSLERMSKVDLAILRMAVAEMLYVDEIIDNVAINEAIEIAKKFSTIKSGKFINGILGAISRSKTTDSGEKV